MTSHPLIIATAPRAGHTDNEPVWTPDPTVDTRMNSFADWLTQHRGLPKTNYEGLWNYSVTDLDGFWSAIWDFFGLDETSRGRTVLGSEDLPGADWFPDATLNFTEYTLAQGDPEAIAIVGVTENGVCTELTRSQLREQVANLAQTLTAFGVVTGDRVVGYLPNIPQAVVSLLAAASIGAVWSSMGQDYAAEAVIDRLGPLEPKVLITADGYRFAGKSHERLASAQQIMDGIDSIEKAILVTHLNSPSARTAAPRVPMLDWQDAITGAGTHFAVQVAFGHPLWVLFSSGTTGKPKGIVHSQGGILLEELKFLGLHTDIGPADRLFWYTSPSWVMWNIQAAALATGAGIVCYDGSPTYDGPAALWKIVADHQVTVFGSSPGYLDGTRIAGVHPSADFDLQHLRILATSGSPISPDCHRWATTETNGLPLFSLSGGTDVASGFCAGSPTVAVHAGEIPVRCLGVAMQSWDENSRSLVDSVGELVITRPMPSMPTGFWNDPDGQRYQDAYFNVFPGVWRHGDWVTITSRGSVIVHGRSDSTLNRHGVRMGSADIYHVVESFAQIAESLVLGVEENNGGYWMPLFIVMTSHSELTEDLKADICHRIRQQLSPRHVPDEIIAVPGLPHTRTGKRLEVPIKRILQGASLDSVIQPNALDDPATLQLFVNLAHARASANGTQPNTSDRAPTRSGARDPS